MKQWLLCAALLSLSACIGGGVMGKDEAWCGWYGERCKVERTDPQCYIWGRCSNESKEEHDPQCSIWGRCGQE